MQPLSLQKEPKIKKKGREEDDGYEKIILVFFLPHSPHPNFSLPIVLLILRVFVIIGNCVCHTIESVLQSLA